jgi:hypothetical protein
MVNQNSPMSLLESLSHGHHGAVLIYCAAISANYLGSQCRAAREDPNPIGMEISIPARSPLRNVGDDEMGRTWRRNVHGISPPHLW